MERTTITMDGCGRIAVPSDAANVWMKEMELVRLFDVIAPTLRAAIRAVYKSGVLKPCDVERRIRLPNGYCAEAYALPMVVAIAFRINTPNAARVRNALLERLCLRKDRQVLFSLFVAKCFVNGFVERLFRSYVTEHQCVILHFSIIQNFQTCLQVCRNTAW